MAALRWSLALLLVLAVGCTHSEASCSSGHVCCRDCGDECPGLMDNIDCLADCSDECSDIQSRLCGAGAVCCDDCDEECPAIPGSCEMNCVDFDPLGCPDPDDACLVQNEVFCDDCDTACPGHPATCEKFCEGVSAQGCQELGERVAAALKDKVCEDTKTACGISSPATTFKSTGQQDFLIDLETCCKVVIGQCKGDIVKLFLEECKETIPGDPADLDFYGECQTEQRFDDVYNDQAKDTCESTICSTPVCEQELVPCPP